MLTQFYSAHQNGRDIYKEIICRKSKENADDKIDKARVSSDSV